MAQLFSTPTGSTNGCDEAAAEDGADCNETLAEDGAGREETQLDDDAGPRNNGLFAVIRTPE